MGANFFSALVILLIFHEYEILLVGGGRFFLLGERLFPKLEGNYQDDEQEPKSYKEVDAHSVVSSITVNNKVSYIPVDTGRPQMALA